MSDRDFPAARRIIGGVAQGPVIASCEALSFWGGVDPATGRVIDARHPLGGVCLSGSVLVLPSSRGSCSGSGVLLDMALNGRAPAALAFREAEDVLTLGALAAAEMFGKSLPVLRLAPEAWEQLSQVKSARVGERAIEAEGLDDSHFAARPGESRPQRGRPRDARRRTGPGCRPRHAHSLRDGG